jgi:hypothetical protein
MKTRPELAFFRRALPACASLATALCLPPLPALADELVRESREVGTFHSVRFDGHGDLEVTVGREFSVVVETTAKALSSVETEVHGEELRIRRERRARRAPLRVEITMPVMASLELNGSAEARVLGPVHAPKFAVRIEGSGSASIAELNVDAFDIDLEGSGRIDAAGAADRLDLETEGSATMQLAKLEVKDASITIEGSGEADLHVSSSLSGRIDGSGEIRLTGSPREMSVRTNGSGRIIQKAEAPAPSEERAE